MGKRPPLGLPEGSVRAALTLMLVGVSALMLFVPIAEGADDIKAMFLMLTGIAVRDYFASRQPPPAPPEESTSAAVVVSDDR